MSEVRALLFDIGNTRLKWGLLEKGRINRTGSVTRSKIRDSGFTSLVTRLPRRVDRVFASNVAGASLATRLSGVIGIHCDCDIHFAHCEKQAYGVTNSYRQPRRMGVDRWVAMIGARSEFRGAICMTFPSPSTMIPILRAGLPPQPKSNALASKWRSLR
jgi:type III pantothenate kinase